MHIRPSIEADLDHILALIADKSVNTAHPERYLEFLAGGQYSPETTWVAVDAEQIVAVAVWWGFGGDGHRPLALDGLFAAPGTADPVPVWTDLIKQVLAEVPAKAEPPSYHLFLAPDWRDDAEVQVALRPRLAAAHAAGMTAAIERLRFEWLSSTPVPARSQRLTFRAEPDDEAFLDVFKRVAAGSLDAATRDQIARAGLDAMAREDLEIYTSMPGERSWWKLAYDVDGDLVGFGIPSRNNAGPVVGYLGVVPERRGHGYVGDILAEITADLAELGAERIVADTDVPNVPMANAFRRLGYREFAVRLVLSRPAA
ncbi:MAG: GNAT family N-acetyltransferase [Hamadaea sp.]|nr:GNAT family N-acetyltransferase [Hamadaea sp.]